MTLFNKSIINSQAVVHLLLINNIKYPLAIAPWSQFRNVQGVIRTDDCDDVTLIILIMLLVIILKCCRGSSSRLKSRIGIEDWIGLEITSVWSQGSLASSWSHEVVSSKMANRHWTTLSHRFRLRLIRSLPVASQIARADILLENIRLLKC